MGDETSGEGRIGEKKCEGRRRRRRGENLKQEAKR